MGFSRKIPVRISTKVVPLRHKYSRLLLVAVLPMAFASAASFALWGTHWTAPDPSDWSVTTEQGSPVLRLLTGKEPLASMPRRPTQFALADAGPFGEVKVIADVQPMGRSLIIVYAFRDPAHFDYAHLSTDDAVREPHHNGIFHVYGGERVRISDVTGPPAFADGHRWYHVTLQWTGFSGEVQVAVDGHEIPALHAMDLSLRQGRVGLGSFDETGNFRNVVVAGQPQGAYTGKPTARISSKALLRVTTPG